MKSDMQMRLPALIGRRVQWNQCEVAEIIEAWSHMEPRRAGVTVVGFDPEAYAVFRRPCGMLVTGSLNCKKLLPAD